MTLSTDSFLIKTKVSYDPSILKKKDSKADEEIKEEVKKVEETIEFNTYI